MSVASWYYCNLLDEASAFVPVVQARQNADQVANVPVVRLAPALAMGTEVDDELAVGRSTYVQSAIFAATSDEKAVPTSQPVPSEMHKGVVTQPAEAHVEPAVESVPVPVTEPEAVAVVPAEVEVIEEAVEAVVPTEEEAVEVAETSVEEEAAASIVEVPEIAAEVAEKVPEPSAVVDVAEPAVEVVATLEPVSVEAEVEETVSEIATVVETVLDAVGAVAVADEIVEPIGAQDAAEEEVTAPEPAAIEEAMQEAVVEEAAPEEGPDAVAAEAPASLTLTSDVPDNNLLGRTRMLSIPEDEESVPVEGTDSTLTEEVAKPTDDDDDSETQSEISEAEHVKVDEEPESEIDETMVIDPVVAAKESESSSYSFLAKQLRNNSYAVSSVAVAVVTAIAASLASRR